jgi:hypothetical protein
MITHDLPRQLDLLHQSLAQARQPLGLFLGAGCGVAVRVPAAIPGQTEALVPDISALTSLIDGRILGDKSLAPGYQRLRAHMAGCGWGRRTLNRS